MNPTTILKSLVPEGLSQRIREKTVPFSVKQLWGPAAIRLSREEAAVICLVKNGEFYLKQFVEHYLGLGFRHIFLLDNGSTDRTIAMAKQYENVSICQCHLPPGKYERELRKHLAERSVFGGWCLWADMDEFFDYPFSDRVSLKQLLAYLNAKQYTAVVTQLLDLFSEKPMSSSSDLPQEDLRKTYRCYDISAVEKRNYGEAQITRDWGNHNSISNENITLCYGGIRKTLYGNDCLLTKHSLFLQGDGLEPFSHLHFVNRARLADFSCVMLHYKFTSNTLHAAIQNRDSFELQGYSDLIELMKNNPGLQIKRSTAAELQRVNDLLENGFLVASADYRAYTQSLKAAKTAGT